MLLKVLGFGWRRCLGSAGTEPLQNLRSFLHPLQLTSSEIPLLMDEQLLYQIAKSGQMGVFPKRPGKPYSRK